MTVQKHYDHHLGNFYSWMTGDFAAGKKKFAECLSENKIVPDSTKMALDLGAGHGVQSAAMAEAGYTVTAVDFSEPLLRELDLNTMGMSVHIVRDDIRSVRRFEKQKPELIVCWGYTLTHLDNKEEVRRFISDISEILQPGGKFLLSFRDYSAELTGDKRFIPVRSDDTRILTCFLEYDHDYVRVTDLLHEKTDHGWQQKVSSYSKVRIPSSLVIEFLEESGINIIENRIIQGMITLISQKNNI